MNRPYIPLVIAAALAAGAAAASSQATTPGRNGRIVFERLRFQNTPWGELFLIARMEPVRSSSHTRRTGPKTRAQTGRRIASGSRSPVVRERRSRYRHRKDLAASATRQAPPSAQRQWHKGAVAHRAVDSKVCLAGRRAVVSVVPRVVAHGQCLPSNRVGEPTCGGRVR